MKRIAIIGSSGSGKSTLARELGSILHLPVYHLDQIFWLPNWVELDKDVWKERHKEICQEKEWVIDGNYGSTMDNRLETCDTVVFLDYSRAVCLFRVLKRWNQYRGLTRPDVTEGCPEELSLDFLVWIWRYRETHRPTVVRKLEQWQESKQILHLKNPRETKRFVTELAASNYI